MDGCQDVQPSRHGAPGVWLGHLGQPITARVARAEGRGRIRIDLVRETAPKDTAELDALEIREWLDSLDYVMQVGGPAKVARLLRELTIHAGQNGVKLPFSANTPYVNTIAAEDEVLMPGDPDLERRIKSSCAGTPSPWS